MTRVFIASIVVATGVTSAFAEVTVKYGMEYYVVMDKATNKCIVETKKPNVTTVFLVENGIFKTRADAEIGTKSLKACSGT